MKKSVLAVLLCIIMVMALLPATAFAVDETNTITDKATSVFIAGAKLTSANPYYHNGASGTPGYTDSNETGYNAHFDAAAGTLTLKGLSVVNSPVIQEMTLSIGKISSANAIFAEGDLTICVDGDNSVSVDRVTETNANAYSFALYVTGALTVQPGVTGGGSLTAEAKGAISNLTEGYAFCIGVTSKTLEVKSGAALTGKVSGNSEAINVQNAGLNINAVTVSGGTLKGIASGVVMCESSSSNFAISCGIIVNNGDLSLSAGSVEATGGNVTATAGESLGVSMSKKSGSISITGGSFTAKSGTAATTVAVQNHLSLGSGITAKGSISSAGSNPVPYVVADNANYKWVSVVPSPTVTSVIVNPATVSIQKGGTQTFNATVTGTNSPAQTVTWTVIGGVTGTSIDEDGVLKVAANETAATLIVKATSTVDTTKSGTATVTVTEPTLPDPIEHEIIKGHDGEWTKGGTGGLGFTADGDYDTFTGVWVDGTDLSSDKYTSQSGSTIVTLKAVYLETLKVGQHTLRINFTDGYAETHFTIKAATDPDNPATGDSSQPLLWLGIALLACAGMAVSIVIARKRRQNG